MMGIWIDVSIFYTFKYALDVESRFLNMLSTSRAYLKICYFEQIAYF